MYSNHIQVYSRRSVEKDTNFEAFLCVEKCFSHHGSKPGHAQNLYIPSYRDSEVTDLTPNYRELNPWCGCNLNSVHKLNIFMLVDCLADQKFAKFEVKLTLLLPGSVCYV